MPRWFVVTLGVASVLLTAFIGVSVYQISAIDITIPASLVRIGLTGIAVIGSGLCFFAFMPIVGSLVVSKRHREIYIEVCGEVSLRWWCYVPSILLGFIGCLGGLWLGVIAAIGLYTLIITGYYVFTILSIASVVGIHALYDS